MPEPILTVEELDLMWPAEIEGEQDYDGNIMRVQGSLRELRNKRTRVKTLEDALDAYDGLVADAYKNREEGLAIQVYRLKNIGRVGTLNFQWGLSANFANAIWLIADHEGPQTLRRRVLDADYGMSLEDDYKPLMKAHDSTLAMLQKEQANTKLQAQIEQVQRTYESDLERIEGAD